MAEKNKKIVDLRSGDPDSPSPPSSEHTEPMEGVSQGETSESEPSHVESSSEGHALHQHVALPGPHILENVSVLEFLSFHMSVRDFKWGRVIVS